MQVPIFITCRDRIGPLRALVDWLERAGQEEIYLVDNASTYPPLLEYFIQTPHTVIRTGGNNGQLVAWHFGLPDKFAYGRPYIVTDPDVVPDEQCPMDAIDYMVGLLNEFPNHNKIGLGLRIDDIPDCYKFKQQVINWENQFWQSEVKPNVYQSPTDTTFAVYGIGKGFELGNSLRTGFPYVAKHWTWYIDSNNPDEEDIYYRDHAEHKIINWALDDLGGWFPK